jgi:Fe-S oxidoreductase
MMEIFELIERNYLEKGNPLGVKIDNSWAERARIPKGGKRILFTGQSYQLMPFTLAALKLLDLLEVIPNFGLSSLKNPFFNFVSEKLGLLMSIVLERKPFEEALVSAALLIDANTGFLYDEEPYDGALLYDFGMEWLVDLNERRIKKVFESNGVEEIITISPHSYHMFKNVYSVDVEVFHIYEILAANGFSVRTGNAMHDPCLLTRKNNLLEPVRKVIRAELPEKNGKMTSCCGGPVELIYPDLSMKIGAKRGEELMGVCGSVDRVSKDACKILTACPICLMNFIRCGFNAEDCLTTLRKNIEVTR